MPAARRPPEVARVLERVTKTVRRHDMFAPRTTVVAAVSGGPDSICLLHALVRLRRLLRVDVTCFHFDHRLRPGSERDAAYVRGQARRLEVPVFVRQAESRPGRGESVEAWARTMRYGAMFEVMNELGAAVAATGHTVDDQAETVLLAALRGGGLEAVAAMRPKGDRVVRPLLDVTRDQTAEFCRALALRPRRDPMNLDPSFMRIALRRRAIPDIERAAGRGVRFPLARTAALLRGDADLLEEMAAEAAGHVLVGPAKDCAVTLRASSLRELPGPIASRVLRGVLLSLGMAPEAGHVEAVHSLADGRSGRRIQLPGGLVARRERGYVRLSRAGGSGADAG